MVLRFFLIAVIFLFATCTEMGDRDNPDDPGGTNYQGSLIPGPSSPSTQPSSSSVRLGSSSAVVPSSSSVLSLPSSSSNSVQANVDYGDDVDYEGGPYKTIKIGSQTWFQRNLNYAVEGSKCGNGSLLSDANTTTCDTYGRLYDWATAMDLPSKCNTTLSTSDAACAITTPNHRGICPSGWHIPSDADWDALMTAVGGSSTAGTKLKANSDLWIRNKGTDTYGFAALPGGYGGSSLGYFLDVGSVGYWWSATENGAIEAYSRYMYYNVEFVSRSSSTTSYYSFSVRCVKD